MPPVPPDATNPTGTSDDAAAVRTTIHVCVTCRLADDAPDGPRGGARLAEALAAAAGPGVVVNPVECLSVCKRPVTVGFSAAGRWTYVYGEFQPDHADLILGAAAQYAAAPAGLIPWRERPDALKRGVVARIPPLTDPEAA